MTLLFLVVGLEAKVGTLVAALLAPALAVPAQ